VALPGRSGTPPCPGEDPAIFRFPRLEDRLRFSFLAVALIPSLILFAFALDQLRDALDRFHGPGIERSLSDAGRLAGELLDRQESEARMLLAEIPETAPTATERSELIRRLAARGFDFVAYEDEEAGTILVPVSDTVREMPGVPGEEEWSALADGVSLPHQQGRVLRFFAPGSASGAPARVLGRLVDEELAETLAAARTDFGRRRNLDVLRQVQSVGLLVGGPAIVLLTAGVAFFVARRTARRIARPVTELAEAADAIARGDLSRRASSIAGEDEIRDLVLAFNRMGEELERSREELVRAERVAAWRDVARRIAHEIKNPLTPVKVAIHRLEGRVPEDAGARECLRSIGEEVENLERIANSFSEFAKMPVPELAPTDFAAVARGVVELFGEASEGVEITYEGPESLPLVADRDLLRRAVTNLVKNAQEAVSGSGEGRAGSGGGRVRVRLAREGESARLEVVDDGPGIPPEIEAELCRPGVSARPGGSGLGLAMVQRIAADHRGTLVWKTEGPGARFVLDIPLKLEEEGR
jgi:nitrogen fixation/metabolism regulation signal transduction histidine kinase